MTDYKTSLLVNKQVPEFIRDEYPVFVSFLEAYYQYLETQQGSQKNDLVSKAKELKYITDVDTSIDDFEDNFFNTFASLVPHNTQVDKAFLIKNILPIYLAKGNEKSFKLLFRMLFADEVNILLPKNNVLRASDGKWTVDNVLKIQTNIRTVYTGNNSNTQYILAQVSGLGEIDVYVNDVIKTVNVDYQIRKETRKVIFNTAPASNSKIEIYYSNFDITALNNRRVVGETSGASALVNIATKRIITDRLNFGLPYELFIDPTSLVGTFNNGEKIITDIIDENGVLINLEADTYSILTGIQITTGGSSYNVGDPVLVLGGGANPPATAIVSEVSSGVITGYLTVDYGGTGFKLSGYANSFGTSANTIVVGIINAVNTSHYSNSTYRVTNDVIQNFNGSVHAANTLINAADYGFPTSYTENVNTRIVDALTPLFVTNLGPITNVGVFFSNVTSNISTFDSLGASYTIGTNDYYIKAFNSVGRIDVTNAGGSGYAVGDEIIFGSNPSSTYGIDAAAYVGTVSVAGAILTVNIGPPHIAGTVSIASSTAITGSGTNFLSDLQLGDMIQVAGQTRYIDSLTNNTAATVNVAFTTTTSGRKLGNYNKNQLGGVNYTQDNFPTVSVSTVSGGSGATVAITSLMGNGEKLTGNTGSVLGSITKISLTSGGSGYDYIPQVELTSHGDGLARARAILGDAYSNLPGRWTTSDSLLSSSERRLAGKDYYTDYSYVTSSVTEFSKYKQILKNLLHPAGYVNYADLNRESTVLVGDSIVSNSNIAVTLSGLVNVNSTIYVIGTGTKFNIANGNTISIGTGNPRSNISVNGEIRLISNIISNTVLRVLTSFTTNANSQTIIVVANT